MKRIRVLMADDSALMRQSLRKILEACPELEVVGVARDGEDAVAKARELKPDVISLDINMPKLDGISVLQIIMAEQICPAVMVSSLTQKGALTTFECLELGAFDFVAKPDGTVSGNIAQVGDELIAKLKLASTSGSLQRLGKRARPQRRAEAVRSSPTAAAGDSARSNQKAIAIGISTGGPSTIMEVLPRLPADINAAVFLVQHMPAMFIHTFVQRLNDACALQVLEAESGTRVEPGHCYVGPGDYQLGVFRKLNGEVVLRTPRQPQTLFMPSVDVMMNSVLQAYGKNTIGTLMTGIGDDGAEQMLQIFKAGGHTIAESEESCIVYGMPRQAIERGAVEVIAPSWKVAAAIMNFV